MPSRPDITTVSERYLDHRRLRLRPRTMRRYEENIRLFQRFLTATEGRPPWSVTLLSKPLLEDYYAGLQVPENGLHGRRRSPDTARKIVEVAQLMWRWADESDRWPDQVPRPRRIDMVRAPPRPVRAPTWAEMDRCIRWARGWKRCSLVVLRYTGIRIGEAVQLEWRDVDLRNAELVLGPEITKGGRGRVVPLSKHLIRELRSWPRPGSLLVPYRGKRQSPWRNALASDAAACWEAARVSEAVWRRAPHHAFRRGFKSNMLRAGAATDAVDYLQGHVIGGARGRYIDPLVAFDLEAAVALIPRIQLK